jgi:hypothetical protein
MPKHSFLFVSPMNRVNSFSYSRVEKEPVETWLGLSEREEDREPPGTSRWEENKRGQIWEEKEI